METYLCHITKVWDGPLDIMDVIPHAVNCGNIIHPDRFLIVYVFIFKIN